METITKMNTSPEFEVTTKSMVNAITKIDNPYLQIMADDGMTFCHTNKSYWVLSGLGYCLLVIEEESIHLECISVFFDERKKGNGTELMKYLMKCSDRSGIPITLRIANVIGNGWEMMQHPAIQVGMDKRNKIPVRILHKWYEKLGFTYTDKKKKEMIYTP